MGLTVNQQIRLVAGHQVRVLFANRLFLSSWFSCRSRWRG